MKNNKDKILKLVYSLSAFLVMWLIWIAFAFSVKNEYLMPSFSDTIKAFFDCFTRKFFYRAYLATLIRVLVAFLSSFVLALACASLAFAFKWFKEFFKPIIAVVRSLPTMAILVMILIWSTPKTAPVIVAFLVLFPMIYSQFLSALTGIDDGILKVAKIFEMSKKDRLTKIYFPLTAPYVFSHIGSNLSFAVKLVVSAEVTAYTLTGLGGMITTAGNIYFQTAYLFALTLVAVLTGIIIEYLFNFIQSKFFKWRKADDRD
ncbi:MAG: ABC transporter permease subunit [Clostridia bacterium]|nr:ABC transporter permease subunit [Clostridia bacterium]